MPDRSWCSAEPVCKACVGTIPLHRLVVEPNLAPACTASAIAGEQLSDQLSDRQVTAQSPAYCAFDAAGSFLATTNADGLQQQM